MNPLTVRAVLRRPGEDLNDLILGKRPVRSRSFKGRLQRSARSFEELDRKTNTDERLHRTLPRSVQLRTGDLSLSRENLPKPDVRLERAQRIGPEPGVGDRSDVIGRAHKALH